jgi:uncharacterized membrane protein YedE/YeeE
MPSTWLLALAGGAMIGCAAALLLLVHGRIAGVSGISAGLLQRDTGDRGWRLAFLGGLAASGLVARLVAPAAIGTAARSLPAVIVAGALVGFGTRLSGGCTSGHGVCGLSQLSPRSAVAVATFMTTGALTALLSGGAP